MKRINSLKGKKIFEELYNTGKWYHHRDVQLIVLKQKGKNDIINNSKDLVTERSCGIQVGIPINRKFGNAVTRNRAKRRIKAICQELLQDVKEDYYFIIRPKTEFKDLNYTNSKQIIQSLFKSAGVLR